METLINTFNNMNKIENVDKENKTNMMNKLIQAFLLCLLTFTSINATAIERITYYHNDSLGSPIAATDKDGNLLWREEYEPYGKRLLKEDGGTNNLWYTGKQEEEAFGINYFGARWYDPSIGRFMAIDPVGFNDENIQSFNRYAYANNNPYLFVDPDGNSPLDIGFFIVDAIAFVSAVNSGNSEAIQSAGLDLIASAVGLASPVPGVGVAIKAAKAGNNAKKALKVKEGARANSRAKRRAAREAQRQHGTPTSRSGKNQQGKPGTPRHQIKEGSDGKLDGVVDGSRDNVPGHGKHIEVGDIKAHEPVNKHGQPRIKNRKSKVNF